MISKIYESLFVAFYGWSLKVDGNKGGFNALYASLMLSLALLLNLAAATMVADLLAPRSFIGRITVPYKTWWVVGFGVFTASQCLYFSFGGRYRKLIAQVGRSEEDLEKGPHWKLVAYMVLSVVLVAALMITRFNLARPL